MLVFLFIVSNGVCWTVLKNMKTTLNVYIYLERYLENDCNKTHQLK